MPRGEPRRKRKLYQAGWNPMDHGDGKQWNSSGMSPRNVTPPKINMEHNNGGLEDDFPFQTGDF